MTAGLDQLDRLLNLPLDEICADTIERHEADIIEFNEAQLDKGLDSTGKSLGQYQNYNYKNRLVPVDLLDTGAFRGSFEVDPITGGFINRATDEKTEKLEAKYGDDIVGTPEAAKEQIGEWLQDDLINEIRDAL